jgi:hypothetical protein
MARFTHYIYIYVYTHHIWRPQGGSSHGAGTWATDPGEILGGMNVSRHFTKKDAVLFKSNRLKVQSDEN